MRLTTRCLAAFFAFAVAMYAPTKVFAYLGGFEAADGYQYGGLGGWFDVTNYDAGQYGPNAGGGAGPTAAPFNGPGNLWHVDVTTPGSFYDNPALRAAQIGAAPPYTGTGPFAPDYVLGNHFGGRLGTTALVLRDSSPAGTGNIKYDYTLDSYDFTGVAPASVTTGTIPMSFFFEPSPVDAGESRQTFVPDPNNPGAGRLVWDPKFIMSITDSTGSVGFEWGYDLQNEVQWRAGNSGPWNLTGIISDAFNYDGVQMSIDLSNDEFGIDYYDISTNTTSTIVPSGTLMGNPMLDFTHIGWNLIDGLNAGVGGKNFFDDFSLPVPEPSSFILSALGALGLIGYARRRKSAQ